MRRLHNLLSILFNRNARFLWLKSRGFYNKRSDLSFAKLAYRVRLGKKLHIKPPVSFNEKIQWLKLYDRKPEYTIMVDKYEAKEYVAKRANVNIIRTLGVWDRFEDVDFESLPNRFVLKCTHNSGGLIICKDKSTFDKKKAEIILNNALRTNYFNSWREWPYKNVKPRIIAEEYMEDESGQGLIDYKFFCFNGKPQFLYVSKGLDNHSTALMSFVTLDWSIAPYERVDYQSFSELPEKPSEFETMIEISKQLSKDLLFLRVDLYQINGKVYFSELTFFPCSGFIPFKSSESDYQLGRMLHLPFENE